jgi:hypothetical protein
MSDEKIEVIDSLWMRAYWIIHNQAENQNNTEELCKETDKLVLNFSKMPLEELLDRLGENDNKAPE